MPRNITSLGSFRTMAEAYSAWERITKSFLKIHRKSENVELTVSSSGLPDKHKIMHGSSASKPIYEIRCHYDEKDRSEVEWFTSEINKV